MSMNADVQWISSTEGSIWQVKNPSISRDSSCESGLSCTGETFQKWQGFGGCFNELGWIALQKVDVKKRDAAMRELFHPSLGCNFSYCRLPIGASDYARSWYSCNETVGDFPMKHFSINRDRESLIPYIKAAQAYQKNMTLFASPWSPPTWLKNPPVYNYGKLVWQRSYLEAYALYFLKFVQAYQRDGIRIDQIHVQNEPCADQKFPSCLWTGSELRDFIKGYLGPLFDKHNNPAQLWLGTLNHEDYDGYPNTVLSDPLCRRYLSGVAFQWGGKHAIGRTFQSYPDVPLIQSENECGDGENTWKFAMYVFDLMRHYVSNGAVAYVYWNMVLEQGGRSTWGWHQNSMISIDPAKRTVIKNPEFYMMKHYSHFIKPGALRLGLSGQWAGNAAAFRNPNGATVFTVSNPFPEKRALCLEHLKKRYSLVLEPQSVNTIAIPKSVDG